MTSQNDCLVKCSDCGFIDSVRTLLPNEENVILIRCRMCQRLLVLDSSA